MPVDLVVEGVPWQGEELVDDAERLLQALSLQQTELSLLVCDDDVMRRLNRDYRGQDRPTDVLAFAMREGEGADPDDLLLGDLVICLPAAQRQARERGHSLQRELRVLLVHGLLHLLGHDHQDDTQETAMESEAARLLALIASA